MKKVFVLCCIPLLLFLGACGTLKPTELNDRLIAEAIGVDLQNGEFIITLQALNTGAGGSGEGTAANEKTKIYNFKGVTPGAALQSAKVSGGLDPLFSHARFLVIGKSAAEHDMAQALDFFLREYNVRSDIPVAVAENTAAEIIRADIADGITDAASLETTMLTGSKSGENVLMPLFRFVNLLLTPGDSAYCPVVRLESDPYSDKKQADLTQTAFFDGGRLLHISSPRTTRGVLILLGETEKMGFEIKTEKGIFTLKAVQGKTKIKPSEKDGKMFFVIETKLVCDLTEFSGEGFYTVSKADIAAAETKLAEDIRETEIRALNNIFLEHGCDLCRFGRMTLLKYPELYEKYEISPAELTETEIHVTAKIRRTGREIIDID